MTTQEIYKTGIRLFSRITTATMNVKNGCRCAEDMQLAFEEVNRLPKMFAWMKENGMWQEFLRYVNSTPSLHRNVDMAITCQQIIEKYSK